jgi:hypothetical protein
VTIKYDIKVDEAALAQAKALFEFIGGNSNEATRVAINKTGPRIRTIASRNIREQVRLKAGYVNERLKFTRATRNELVGRIRTPSRGILLSRFSTDTQISGDKVSWIKPPPTPPRGIRVKVKPTGAAKVFGGHSDIDGQPFYLVLGNGRIAIAGRRKVPGPRGGKFRVFYGPSLSQVYDDVKDDVGPEASEAFTREMADAMRYLLNRRVPR